MKAENDEEDEVGNEMKMPETKKETEEAAETQLQDDEVETQFKLPVHPVSVLVSFSLNTNG